MINAHPDDSAFENRWLDSSGVNGWAFWGIPAWWNQARCVICFRSIKHVWLTQNSACLAGKQLSKWLSTRMSCFFLCVCVCVRASQETEYGTFDLNHCEWVVRLLDIINISCPSEPDSERILILPNSPRNPILRAESDAWWDGFGKNFSRKNGKDMVNALVTSKYCKHFVSTCIQGKIPCHFSDVACWVATNYWLPQKSALWIWWFYFSVANTSSAWF